MVIFLLFLFTVNTLLLASYFLLFSKFLLLLFGMLNGDYYLSLIVLKA